MTTSSEGAPTEAVISAPEGHPARRLAVVAVPAIVVGVLCSLSLIAISGVAEWFHRLWWERLPEQFGFDASGPLFIIVVLTVVGVATGLVVWLVPGHAGPDPATTGLAGPPLPLVVLPGLVLCTILTLSGGVSLGPEFPIMAVNTALVCAIGAKVLGRLPLPLWAELALCGTIGALFGAPIAAALLLSEVMAEGTDQTPLWDRLVAPLSAAGAGALTTAWLSDVTLKVDLPPYPGFRPVDLVTGSILAAATAAIGMGAVYAFPWFHRQFHRLRHPVAIAAAGGLVLGLLGALGGPLTLNKGLDEIEALAIERAGHTAAALFGLAAVKLVALLVAGTSGFRGGRIFPAIFVGAALGLAANALIPDIPVSLAVAAGTLGLLMAATRSGWLSLFTAAVLVPDPSMLLVLTLLVLPAWLVCTGRPPMQVEAAPAPGADATVRS